MIRYAEHLEHVLHKVVIWVWSCACGDWWFRSSLFRSQVLIFVVAIEWTWVICLQVWYIRRPWPFISWWSSSRIYCWVGKIQNIDLLLNCFWWLFYWEFCIFCRCDKLWVVGWAFDLVLFDCWSSIPWHLQKRSWYRQFISWVIVIAWHFRCFICSFEWLNYILYLLNISLYLILRKKVSVTSSPYSTNFPLIIIPTLACLRYICKDRSL